MSSIPGDTQQLNRIHAQGMELGQPRDPDLDPRSNTGGGGGGGGRGGGGGGGGLVTMPFIIANEALEKVASYGLAPNMIFYLMSGYNMGIAKGTSILFLWSAATNFTPAAGAFLADSYLGRFLTIALGTLSSFLGMTLLWLTTVVPGAKPSPCDPMTRSCEPASVSQMALLISSFALMAIGAGGVRPCSLAFGADQFDQRDDPGNERVLESYFSWYYASAAASVVVALSCMVYIQDHLGWKIGYCVPALLLLLSAFLFLVASPLYVKVKATDSLFTGLAQVVVAAFKNRKVALPTDDDSDVVYYNKKGGEIVVLTDKLRFLNKGCVVSNPEKDISADGAAVDPWSLCTVEQVEELKALLKVLPVWSTGMLMSINVSQTSFPVLQASSMDRHIASGSSFQIPAGSFYVFLVIAITVWVILYDRVIIPSASKLRGKPVRLGVMMRMGIGISLSTLAMVVSAIIEHVRRGRAMREGLADDPRAVVHMSAMWLVPQYCLQGLAEAFNAIGQTEFYYSEFPKSMSSIAACLSGLGMAVANVLAIPIVNAVDKITSRGGKPSWVSNNINRGHYDKYYWLLAFISFANIFYFLACSWAYGPITERGAKDTRSLGSRPTPIKEQEMVKPEKI